MDRARFFAGVRATVFGGRLPQSAVDGIEAILEACRRHGVSDPHHVANILAQVRRETGGYMLPIKETVMPSHKDKAPSDATVIARLDRAFASGKLSWVRTPYWRQGWFGRGQLQISHESNYRAMGERLGVDLVGNRDLALELSIGADIAVVGMAEGRFTGRKLADYDFPSALAAKPKDNPRRIVNGQDGSDAEVAKSHRLFHEALIAAGWGLEPEAATVEQPKPVAAENPAPQPKPRPAAKPAPVPAVDLFPAPIVPAVRHPTEDAILVGPVGAPSRDMVTLVQRLLRAKGYPEVGMPNGDYGDRTKDAITIFQRHAGLPLDGLISAGLVEALGAASSRTVSIERATATAKTLSEARPVRLGQMFKAVSASAAAFATIGGIFSGTATVDDLAANADLIETLLPLFVSVGPWVSLGIVGVGGFLAAREQIEDFVRSFRAGRNV